MAKQKKKNKDLDDFTEETQKVGGVKEIVNFVREERFRVVIGVAIISFAVFLAVAFISYIFTWKYDQSKLDIAPLQLIKSADTTTENWMGKAGAILSNIFIHKWFGVASFSFIIFLITAGLRLLKVRMLPLRKTIIYCLLLTFWLSITLGFIYGTEYFWLGGAHGYFISKWLNAFWGELGTILFLFVVFLTFIIYGVKNSLEWFKNAFKRTKKEPATEKIDEKISEPETLNQELSKDDFQDLNTEFQNLNSNTDIKEEVIEETAENTENTEPEQKPETEPEYDKAVEEIKTIKVEKKEETADSIPFIIEQKKEESAEDNAEEVIEEEDNDDFEEEVFEETKPEPKVDSAILFEVKKIKKEEAKESNASLKTEEPEKALTDTSGIEFTVETKETEIIELQDLKPDEQRMANLSAPFDPKLELSHFKNPPAELLVDYKSESEVTEEELNTNKNRIVDTLKTYNIDITSIKATIGPTITLYEIVPAPGIRINKIKNLEDDIALSLSALGIRIIAPMPGKGTIGIEVPNLKPEVVSMRSVISSAKFQETKFDLPIAIGKTISNDTFTFDLAKMPHLLVAGATGQGKSVGLNAILTSLLFKKHPSQLKFVLVDPKKVELTLYSKIERHYLAKLPDAEEAIICDTHKVVNTLNSLCKEMDSRYDLLKTAQVRNIKEYNSKFVDRRLNPEKGHKFLPYIVVVIDEFADLIMVAGKEVELPIARIAQLARAVGIHMIIATQRPSTNIITGTIKANFPARVAFKVASMIDSRTILDSPGANQLIGKGDMLITQGNELIRVQCAFVDTPEVEQICDYIGNQQGYTSAFLLPEYVPEGGDGTNLEIVDAGKRDDLFEEAAKLIVVHQQGSTSLIQRHMSIGYNRAGRIIDQLEKAGIVGPFEGSKARKVLYSDIISLEQYLNSLK